METETAETQKGNNTKKPPPIIVTGSYNYRIFSTKIKNIIKSDNYRIQYLSKSLKVFINNETDYDEVKKEIQDVQRIKVK